MDRRVQQRQRLVATAAMHHAIEVVGPALGARAAVAQGDTGLSRQVFAIGIDLRVGHIEHCHGVGGEARLVVAHDKAEPAQRAGVEPGLQLRAHAIFGAGQRVGPDGVRRGYERQSGFDQRGQRHIGRLHARRARLQMRVGARGAVQVKAQVDAVGALHGQAQHGQVCFRFDSCQRSIHQRTVAASHHEPQVQGVLALVVVVDARVRRDHGGHTFQPLGWDRHGAQQGGTARAGCPHAAQAAGGACVQQIAEGVEDFGFCSAFGLCDVGKRRAGQRKAALPVVEQAGAERCFFPFPRRGKMGIGAGPVGRGRVLPPPQPSPTGGGRNTALTPSLSRRRERGQGRVGVAHGARTPFAPHAK